MTRLIMYGQYLRVPIQVQLGRLQSWLDGLFLAEAAPPAEGEKKGGLPTWAIIAIVAVVVVCLGAICLFFVLPLLLGPAIGDVFSDVIDEVDQ